MKFMTNNERKFNKKPIGEKPEFTQLINRF